jgi:D-serine deaminase-like pyridoxal phosphate-dependent protein
MTRHNNQSTRATVDVINFWCVAILVISAASVAGVVGAAVVAGEFEDRNFNVNATDNNVEASVLMETQSNGNTRIRWSSQGEAQRLEIRAGGEVIQQLNFVGEEVVIEEGTFEVYAIYESKPETLMDSRG